MPGPDFQPVLHRWKIVCREPGLCVNEQITQVLTRVAPHTEAIAALARRLAAEERQGPRAALEIVRHFNDEDDLKGRAQRGDPHEETPSLFGWQLGREVLNFLHATGAVLNVDEYDLVSGRADD